MAYKVPLDAAIQHLLGLATCATVHNWTAAWPAAHTRMGLETTLSRVSKLKLWVRLLSALGFLAFLVLLLTQTVATDSPSTLYQRAEVSSTDLREAITVARYSCIPRGTFRSPGFALHHVLILYHPRA